MTQEQRKAIWGLLEMNSRIYASTVGIAAVSDQSVADEIRSRLVKQRTSIETILKGVDNHGE